MKKTMRIHQKDCKNSAGNFGKQASPKLDLTCCFFFQSGGRPNGRPNGQHNGHWAAGTTAPGRPAQQPLGDRPAWIQMGYRAASPTTRALASSTVVETVSRCGGHSQWIDQFNGLGLASPVVIELGVPIVIALANPIAMRLASQRAIAFANLMTIGLASAVAVALASLLANGLASRTAIWVGRPNGQWIGKSNYHWGWPVQWPLDMPSQWPSCRPNRHWIGQGQLSVRLASPLAIAEANLVVSEWHRGPSGCPSLAPTRASGTSRMVCIQLCTNCLHRKA